MLGLLAPAIRGAWRGSGLAEVLEKEFWFAESYTFYIR